MARDRAVRARAALTRLAFELVEVERARGMKRDDGTNAEDGSGDFPAHALMLAR